MLHECSCIRIPYASARGAHLAWSRTARHVRRGVSSNQSASPRLASRSFHATQNTQLPRRLGRVAFGGAAGAAHARRHERATVRRVCDSRVRVTRARGWTHCGHAAAVFFAAQTARAAAARRGCARMQPMLQRNELVGVGRLFLYGWITLPGNWHAGATGAGPALHGHVLVSQ